MLGRTGSVLVILVAACNLIDVGLSESCYNCVQCTDLGAKYDCTILSNSPYCYLAIDEAGSVSRSCGIEQLDDFNFPLGCTSANGATICKCRGYLCNTFEDKTGHSSGGSGGSGSSGGSGNIHNYGGSGGGSYGGSGQTTDSAATSVNLSSLMTSLSALAILARYYK